ncbi:MAG: PIN domain-containing protein [Pseudomonadota bacterium]|nr:MAG: PIN domain-containing protein [Pseudomonadota bacterium]
MRLFLDANILFSAAWSEGAAARLLWNFSRAGRCRMLSSQLAVEEARRNIVLKRPHRLATFERLVAGTVIGREPNEEHLELAGEQRLPSKDIPILAAALAQRAEILVTGDRRDFGHLYHRSISGLTILPLADTVEHLLDGG